LTQLPDWHLTPDGQRDSQSVGREISWLASSFLKRCAEVAEAENHHPDLHLEGYRKRGSNVDTCCRRPVGERFHFGAKI